MDRAGMNTTPTYGCHNKAWRQHKQELRSFLANRTRSAAEADDLLQEVFLKAMLQGNAFCQLDNPRAWLFEVARNALADHLRRQHPLRDAEELPEEIPAPSAEDAAVDHLAQCLPRVLSELSPEDRLAIVACDIEGMTQAEFAAQQGISLPGAKSRVQRARQRLKARLSEACRVRFDALGKVCCFTPRPPLTTAPQDTNDNSGTAGDQ